MIDEFRKVIVKTWMNRAKENYSGLVDGLNPGLFYADGLIYTWIAFEAYCCSEFPLWKVEDRNNTFSSKFQSFFENMEMPERLNEALSKLYKNPIKDMRPNSRKPPIQISDKSNLKQIIDIIYRIRCNLFHGGKEMNNQRDIELVKYSFYLLYGILDRILKQEGIL